MSEDHPEFTYSVKIERTAKGARYTVHAYNQNKQMALDEAVGMYVALAKLLEAQGQVAAPVEKGGKDEK